MYTTYYPPCLYAWLAGKDTSDNIQYTPVKLSINTKESCDPIIIDWELNSSKLY